MSWVEEIKSEFPLLNTREMVKDEWELTISKEHHFALLKKLKELKSSSFNHLADLTGYDEHPRSPRFHVVYHLVSMEGKCRCSVVVPLADENPELQTITELWAGANWLEREVYDMLGIRFTDHPDMRRILLPPTFKGHPLKKDFIVDYRQEFQDVPGDEIFDVYGNTLVNKATLKSEEIER